MRYAIGDVHGRPFWKNYIKEKYSEFYFVGDYFDTHSSNMGFSRQLANFQEICAAARKDHRIKLCLGNHDYHYLRGVRGEEYSGFQAHHRDTIAGALEQNMDLINVLYVTGDGYLVSHAGLTATFLLSIGGKKPEDVNAAFEKDRNVLRFNGRNIYGDDVTQSPIWVRPGSLREDPLPGYSQIAGHTPVKEITELELEGGGKLVLIDTYDTESIYRF